MKKIKNLPKITNIDRIRVYHHCKLVAEKWIGGDCHSILGYFQEEPKFKAFLECEIIQMIMYIIADRDEYIACDIYLKKFHKPLDKSNKICYKFNDRGWKHPLSFY